MRIVVLCLVVAAICVSVVHAQTTAYEVLLTESLGQRARGMGGVGVALPGPSYALDINPALLVNQPDSTIVSAGAIWLPTTTAYKRRFVYPIDFAENMAIMGLAGEADMPVESGSIFVLHGRARLDRLHWPLVVAVSYARYRQDSTYYRWSSDFATQEEFTLGIAYRPARYLAVGYAVHRLSERVHTPPQFTYRDKPFPSVWAHDIGLYVPGVLPQTTIWPSGRGGTDRGLHAGMAFRNLSPSLNYDGRPLLQLPREIVLGLGWQVSNVRTLSLLLTTEIRRSIKEFSSTPYEVFKQAGNLLLDAVTLSSRYDDRIGVGMECWLDRQLEVRGGLATDDIGRFRNASFGLGISTRICTFQYTRTLRALRQEFTDSFEFAVAY